MAAGWRTPVFTPADELRSKTDAYEGTWEILYDYEDGLPNFTYSETANNWQNTTRRDNFVARAKTARAAFNAVRTNLATVRTYITNQISTQGA